jgi:hypothetical protein
MPRWKLKLEPQQMWYLVAFLKTLPQDEKPIIEPYQSIDSAAWQSQSALPAGIVSNYEKLSAGAAKSGTGGSTNAH